MMFPSFLTLGGEPCATLPRLARGSTIRFALGSRCLTALAAMSLLFGLAGKDAPAQSPPPANEALPQSPTPSPQPLAPNPALLDDLTGDLFEGLEKEVRSAPKNEAPKNIAPQKEPSPSEPGQEKPSSDTDPGRSDPARPTVPIPGEDIGEASNPLQEIGRMMQFAQQRLAEQDAGAQTQRQQQDILDQLAKLIEQSQQPQSSGSPPSDQNNQQQQIASRSNVNQDQPDKPKGQPQDGQAGDGNRAPGQNPLDSDQDLREGAVEASETALRGELMKDVWGHLPPHVREAMLNVPTGEYLPQYAPLIERYFRRLAEQYRSTP